MKDILLLLKAVILTVDLFLVIHSVKSKGLPGGLIERLLLIAGVYIIIRLFV